MPTKKGLQVLSETYNPSIFIGGADGDRTHDLMNAVQALSQLSYSPICRLKIFITIEKSKLQKLLDKANRIQ